MIVFPAKFEKIADNPNYRPSGYADRMKRSGILYRATASAERIRLKSFNAGLKSSSSSWRDKIVSKIEKSSLSRPTSEFLVALLLGDRSLVRPDVSNSFSNAGVAHVLALSGMHVAIIMGIILFLLFPLKLIGLHMARYWIALVLVWLYAFFSGLAPSTVRACIMTTFVIMALTLQRRNAAGNALLASAFVILLFDPYALFDVGMQLSFVCVAGILAFAGPLNTVGQHAHPWLHSMVSAVLVSLVATLCTWVLVSDYFSKVPLLFLPANLVILPLLPIFVSAGILYLAFLLMGVDIHPLASLLDLGYDLFLKLTEHLSLFGDAVINYQVQLPVVVLWILGILMIGYAIRKRQTILAYAFGGFMLAGALFLVPVLSHNVPDGVIFQQKYYDISVALYDSDKESTAVLPRNSVSRIVHKGAEIISVDCASGLDSLATFVSRAKKEKRRYMIIGSGFKGKSLRDLPGLKDCDRVILHSSMKNKLEQEYLKEASELGLDKIYSIRSNGPLQIDF